MRIKSFNQIKKEIESKYEYIEVLSCRRKKINNKTRIYITITDGVNTVETYYDNVKRRGYDFYKKTEYTFDDIQHILSKNNYTLLKTWVEKDTRKRYIKFKNKENKIASCNMGDYLRQGYTFKKSKGEIYFENFLLKNNIEFETQKSFDDCKNINKLKFDFYLSEYNTCVEIQGRQHYEVVSIFGGEEGLKNTIFRDNIKRKYCELNNIKLIEIKTTDVEKIKVNDIV